MAKWRGRFQYAAAMTLTAAVIAGMLFYKQERDTAAMTVEVVTLSRQAVEETVVVAGTVSTTDGIEVFTKVPCVVGTVCVKEGDKVKEGDTLFTVDRSATLAMALGAGLSPEQAESMSAACPSSITAPADGVVSTIGATTGETLATDRPVAVLSSGDGVQIAVSVRESVLSKLAVGQSATVTGVAFEKECYDGTLSSIAAQARSRVSGTSSQTVVDAVVTLSPEQADASLLVGLSAKVSVVVGRLENMLLLPYECLTQDDVGNTAVYCIENGQASRRLVTLGRDYAGGVEVLGGVGVGDVVVKDPDNLSGGTIDVTAEETA